VLIKAVALALRDVPELKGFWTDGGYKPGGGIHPGIAISLRGGGLVAPAIHHANQKDLGALMDLLRDLVARRTGGLKSSELADPTVTITNLGEQGVEVGYGIIYPPQVALVSFGKSGDRPVANLDSMDALNFVIALYEEFGADILETDYAKPTTLDGIVAYLGARLADRHA
jgi:pyruvate dehydrogenase E2 component (dihydrolipoamide acetyltransferase)